MSFHRISALLVAFISLFSVVSAQESGSFDLQQIYADHSFDKPLSLQIAPDGTDRRFLVEQTGRILLLGDETSAEEPAVFLDLSDKIAVEKDFEEGLLGLAFHPQYRENGKFYLTFSRQGPKRLVLAEYQVNARNPNAADPESERVLMEVQQPAWNHNSGNLFFGPKDGLLYLCVGDGGMRNGVFQLSQKLYAWNGKVLRIDVDQRSGDLPYGIPDDNPFLDTPNASPEIYAYGFRNPWGVHWDPETDLFYLADVGQDLWEEINIVEKGGNYGWEHLEGSQEFAARTALMDALGRKNKVPRGAQFIDPIHQYTRTDGMSITGGYVYRGTAIPHLQGKFLFGDWRFGNLWALAYSPAEGKVTSVVPVEQPTNVAEPRVQPTGIYPDEQGEPIVLDWKGKVFRITK